jgi:hypothetical protein
MSFLLPGLILTTWGLVGLIATYEYLLWEDRQAELEEIEQ